MNKKLTASERYESAQKRPTKGYTIRFSSADMKAIEMASRPSDYTECGKLIVARVVKRMANLPSAQVGD